MKNINKIDEHTWEIRFSYVDDLTGERRRVRRRVEGSLTDAIAMRDRLRVAALDGTLETGSEALTERNLAGWWEDYKVHREHMDRVAASTLATERQRMEANVLPDIGIWRPAHIETRHLTRVVSTWLMTPKGNGDMYSPATIRKRWMTTRKFLKWTYRRIGRPTAHLDEIESPTAPTPHVGQALTSTQAQAFLEALKSRNRITHALTLTLLITGQRWGSVAALRWEDVDLDEKTMTFAQSHYRGRVKARNKSGKMVRLPIPDLLSEALMGLREWMLRTQHVNVGTGLVFPTDTPAEDSATGGYRVSGDSRAVFREASKDAGITPTVKPHDLRRTAITWMVDAGVSGTVVRAIAGHSRAAMTDHYYRGDIDAKRGSLEHIAGVIKPG